MLGETKEVEVGLKVLEKRLKISQSPEGLPVEIKKGEGLEVILESGKAVITYEDKPHFFRAIGLLVEQLQKGETNFEVKEQAQFETVGPMFDFSRNAVMNVTRLKEMIEMLALMGFDSMMLYMEDTYEVKEEPYFGYMRGRYSAKELKELDDYGYQFGIELIPCIHCSFS